MCVQEHSGAVGTLGTQQGSVRGCREVVQSRAAPLPPAPMLSQMGKWVSWRDLTDLEATKAELVEAQG